MNIGGFILSGKLQTIHRDPSDAPVLHPVSSVESSKKAAPGNININFEFSSNIIVNPSSPASSAPSASFAHLVLMYGIQQDFI